MNILITGATGFIGTALIDDFYKDDYNISVLTRNKKHVKQKFLKVYECIDDIASDSVFDVIINLAGAPISKRWTRSYKKNLVNSRMNVTNSIYNLVKRLEKKPKTVISASAIGYYGNQGDMVVNEDAIPSQDFTHDLCRLWEQEALRLEALGVNVIIIRLGVVLGMAGGILKETVPVFKMLLGGKIGSGKQYISWVHMTDVVRAIKFLFLNTGQSGIYNLTAPFPATNELWTKELSQALNKPALFPLPAIVVKILFGEMGESLLLHGQKVIPKKLEDAGFKFKYLEIKEAFLNIF